MRYISTNDEVQEEVAAIVREEISRFIADPNYAPIVLRSLNGYIDNERSQETERELYDFYCTLDEYIGLSEFSDKASLDDIRVSLLALANVALKSKLRSE